MSSLASTFIRVDDDTYGHRVLSYPSTGQGGWSFRVVIVSCLASTFVRVGGESG